MLVRGKNALSKRGRGIPVKFTLFICFDTNMYIYEYVYAFLKLEKDQVLLFH